MSHKKWWKKLFKIFCTNVWSQVKSNVIVRRRNIFSYVWNWVKQLVFWTKCVFSCVSGESETSEIYVVMWEKNNNWWLIEQLKFFHVQNEFFISFQKKILFFHVRNIMWNCEKIFFTGVENIYLHVKLSETILFHVCHRFQGKKKKTSCVKLSENSKIQVNTFLHVWNWVKIMGSFAGEEKLTCETNFFFFIFQEKGKKIMCESEKKTLRKTFLYFSVRKTSEKNEEEKKQQIWLLFFPWEKSFFQVWNLVNFFFVCFTQFTSSQLINTGEKTSCVRPRKCLTRKKLLHLAFRASVECYVYFKWQKNYLAQCESPACEQSFHWTPLNNAKRSSRHHDLYLWRYFHIVLLVGIRL